MALKFTITKDEHAALPEQSQALYTAEGDGYKLAVEGLPEPADPRMAGNLRAATEARNAALKERDDLRTRYADMDPDEYRAMKQREAERKAADEASQTREQKLEAGLKDLTARFEKSEAAREAAIREAADARHAATFAEHATKAGVRPGAVKMLQQALGQIENGGADGALTIGGKALPDAIAGAKDEYGYLFAESKGAGGAGGDAPPDDVDPYTLGRDPDKLIEWAKKQTL